MDSGPAPTGGPRTALLTGIGVLLVAAFVVLTILGVVVEPTGAARFDLVVAPTGHARYVAAAIELAGLLALTARWRAPATVLVGEAVAVAVVHALPGAAQATFPLFLVVVAAYAVAVTQSTRRTMTLTAAAFVILLTTSQGVGPPVVGGGPTIVEYFLLLTTVAAVGMNIKSRRELLDSYQSRAEQAEREQQLVAAQAVTSERHRIARDLHDIVAHHVSLLVVQAGAVRETVPAGHTSRGVLDSMIDGGRQAMSELRDMLDALRIDQPGRQSMSLQPGPGIDEIAGLVEGACGAGLPVQLEVRGSNPGSLSEGTSVAAYRIVQEALTNVAKHAPGTPAFVSMDYGPSALAIRVASAHASSRDGRLAGGHGLIGMKERAALAHGALTAGPVPGGYLVTADLPYVSSVEAS